MSPVRFGILFLLVLLGGCSSTGEPVVGGLSDFLGMELGLEEEPGTPTPEQMAESPGDPYRSWSLPLFQSWTIRPYSSVPIAGGNDRAFVGTREGRLAAVDPDSGTVLWVRDLPARIGAGVAQGDDGRIYVGTDGGEVLALKAGSGETVWRAQVSSEVSAKPLVAAGMVFVRTADDFLWALRASDGGERWSFNVEGRGLVLRGAASPAFHEGTVFTGFSNGELVALDAENGSPRWREALAEPSGRTELAQLVDVDAAPRVIEGRVISAAYQASVVAFSASEGQQLWERSLSVHNNPAVAPERVFLTTTEGSVMALDPASGGTLWTQKALQGSGSLSPPVITGRAVAVGDGLGRVTWIHRESGKVLGQKDLGPSAVHGAPLALEDGALLALTDQGTLNRIGLD